MKADRLFRALSDGTRLRILLLLLEREWCVGDVVKILRVPQAKTSRHLTYLLRCGVVRRREQGLWCFYSLARPEGALHRRLLEDLAACRGGVSGAAQDERRARRLAKEGGCCP